MKIVPLYFIQYLDNNNALKTIVKEGMTLEQAKALKKQLESDGTARKVWLVNLGFST